jgi:hypothetical protein
MTILVHLIHDEQVKNRCNPQSTPFLFAVCVQTDRSPPEVRNLYETNTNLVAARTVHLCVDGS